MASQATQQAPPSLDIAYEDDAEILRGANTEDYAGHITPDSWRAGSGALAMAWLGFPRRSSGWSSQRGCPSPWAPGRY